MNSQEYIICPFCEGKFIKHFPTFRDHINEHDSEIIDMLSVMEVEKCYICNNKDANNNCPNCDQLVCDEHFQEFRKICDNCLNIDYNKGIRV